jgi:hypothetical protein
LYFEDGQDSENKYIRNNIADKIITMLKNKNLGSITTQQLFDDCNKGAIPVCYTTNCDIKDQRPIEDISNEYEIVLATEEYKLINVNFTHEDVSHYFSIAVEEEDFWVGIGDFDVHYCEDYNAICVYPVVDGVTEHNNCIHQQDIFSEPKQSQYLTEMPEIFKDDEDEDDTSFENVTSEVYFGVSGKTSHDKELTASYNKLLNKIGASGMLEMWERWADDNDVTSLLRYCYNENITNESL